MEHRRFDKRDAEKAFTDSLVKIDINKLKAGFPIKREEIKAAYKAYIKNILEYRGTYSKTMQEIFIDESIGLEEGEEIFDSYKKALIESFVEDIGVDPEVKAKLLKKIDQKRMFFAKLRRKSLLDTSVEMEIQENSKLNQEEKDYLSSKIKYGATIPLDEARMHDPYLDTCLEKVDSNDEESLDERIAHVWQRKLSGTYKTREQHQSIIDLAINNLTDEEIVDLDLSGCHNMPWNHFVHSNEGKLFYDRTTELKHTGKYPKSA